MNFREMDPAKILEILEETDEKGVRVYRDILTPLATKEQAVFRHSPCPGCGGTGHEPFVDPNRPFIQGNLLPNKRLRCSACRTEFDPFSGLITRVTDE
jgi:hypothetical protein